MKIEARQVEAFLKKPDPKVRGVVIYGNDDGLVAERAVALARTICEDLKDPFRVVDIAGDVLKHDPARLADEFGALSMMGGRRVIRVRPAGEESVTALENLVEATAGDALGRFLPERKKSAGEGRAEALRLRRWSRERRQLGRPRDRGVRRCSR